jgi:FkbM family methyltransferase
MRDSLIKQLIFRSPLTTGAARVGKAIIRRFTKQVHDRDFEALASLDLKHKLSLDIGANTGQSAISILSVCPESRVLSLEPNPACAKPLSALSAMFGSRMEVLPFGAGETDAEMAFYVPTRNGRQLLEEGTFSKDTLKESASVARIGIEGRDYEIDEIRSRVVRIDDLGLCPAFVKIDVQGLELQVLKGMVETIRTDRPVIMLERGENEGVCTSFLENMGYSRNYWDGQSFVNTALLDSINVFFLPE